MNLDAIKMDEVARIIREASGELQKDNTRHAIAARKEDRHQALVYLASVSLRELSEVMTVLIDRQASLVGVANLLEDNLEMIKHEIEVDA